MGQPIQEPPLPANQPAQATAEAEATPPEAHVIPPERDWPATDATVDEEASRNYVGQ